MSDQAERLRNKLAKMAKQAKVIAIVSGKGGVGKSTFTLNFALGLIEEHKRVLALDMDIGFGNLDILMGLQAEHSITDVLKGTHSLEDIIEVGPRGISYIGAGSGLTELSTTDDSSFSSFIEQLDKLSESYHYILLDMGAGLNSESLQFILAADEVITVCTPEPTSLVDAYSMLKYLTKNNIKAPFKLVVNRINSKKEGVETQTKISQALKQFLDKSITPIGYIPNDSSVSKSITEQRPILLSRPNSQPARAIQKITADYLYNNEPVDKSRESIARKLSRFFKR